MVEEYIIRLIPKVLGVCFRAKVSKHKPGKGPGLKACPLRPNGFLSDLKPQSVIQVRLRCKL